MITEIQKTKTIEIPAEMIRNIPNEAIQIIPPPGENKAIIIENVLVKKPAGTAYVTTASPSNSGIEIAYEDSTVYQISMDREVLLEQAEETGIYATPLYNAEIEFPENKAITLGTRSGILTIETGDSPLLVTINYHIIEFPF